MPFFCALAVAAAVPALAAAITAPPLLLPAEDTPALTALLLFAFAPVLTELPLFDALLLSLSAFDSTLGATER